MPQHRRNLYVLSVAIFLAAVSWNQVLPFLPRFLEQMGVKHNLLQWSGVVYAAQSLAAIVTLPFWGKMGDRYGQKRMTIRAGVCLVGIYLGMSLCSAPWQLAVLRFLNGALTGFVPGSVALIACNTPKELAPRAVATAQTSSAVGQIIGPAIGGVMAAIIGYRGSMRVSGAAVLISTVMVWRLVRVKDKPAPTEKTSLIQDFAVSLKSPVLASVMLAVMLGSAFIAGMQPFLVIHLGRIAGRSPDWLAGAIFSLPPLAFLASARLWTRCGETWGFHRVVSVGLLGAALSGICLTPVRNIWVFGVVFFISGIFLATISPSCGAIICDKVEEGFRGRAYGMLYSAGTFGALWAPLAAGPVASWWGLPVIFACLGGLLVVGAAAFRGLVQKWPGTTPAGQPYG
jgi:DHA1 family multidrug resistance protein-like MFS transporter